MIDRFWNQLQSCNYGTSPVKNATYNVSESVILPISNALLWSSFNKLPKCLPSILIFGVTIRKALLVSTSLVHLGSVFTCSSFNKAGLWWSSGDCDLIEFLMGRLKSSGADIDTSMINSYQKAVLLCTERENYLNCKRNSRQWSRCKPNVLMILKNRFIRFVKYFVTSVANVRNWNNERGCTNLKRNTKRRLELKFERKKLNAIINYKTISRRFYRVRAT